MNTETKLPKVYCPQCNFSHCWISEGTKCNCGWSKEDAPQVTNTKETVCPTCPTCPTCHGQKRLIGGVSGVPYDCPVCCPPQTSDMVNTKNTNKPDGYTWDVCPICGKEKMCVNLDNGKNVCAPPEKSEAVPVITDMVNHPPHYTSHPSGVECIQVTEHMSFCIGNAIKYLWRADAKGSPIEDLEKAQWYVAREIERRKKQAP